MFGFYWLGFLYFFLLALFFYVKFGILYPFVYFPLWFWSRWIGLFRRWKIIRLITVLWAIVALTYASLLLASDHGLIPEKISEFFEQHTAMLFKMYGAYSREHPILSTFWPVLFVYSCFLLYGAVIYVPVIIWLQRKEGWFEEVLDWLKTCQLKKPNKGSHYDNVISFERAKRGNPSPTK